MQLEKIRVIRFADGERFPLLIDGASGAPALRATVYTTAMVRNANRALRTMEIQLRAIAALRAWGRQSGIDPEAIVAAGGALDAHRLDDLSALLRRSFDTTALERQRSPRVVRVGVRRPAPKPEKNVNKSTAATRIAYVRAYLAWLASMAPVVFGEDAACRSEAVARMLLGLATRAKQSHHYRAEPREGLGDDERRRLLEISARDSRQNPFESRAQRARNEVFVRLMYETGVRRGEALGVKVEDVNLRSLEISIHRRAGDPEETRRDAPNAKTRARLVPISAELAGLLQNYVLEVRAAAPAARLHPFLFVSLRAGRHFGAPLSLSSANKMMARLRKATSIAGLSPHILRHTWNDRFSERVDAARADGETFTDDEEKRLRSALMGWSPTSNTADGYTRRHDKRAAARAMAEMNTKLFDEV